MRPQPGEPGTTDSLRARNQQFYDGLWAAGKLVDPSAFNTWPQVSALSEDRADRLEIGPGLRPRLLIDGTHFADISAPALAALAARGGITAQAPIQQLPYADDSFDLVAALDIVEHVEDDTAALAEIRRVLRPDGLLLLSVPLFAANWSPFDDLVGHYRRYEPDELTARLGEMGLHVHQGAAHGMKPQASWLVDLGMWFLRTHPKIAMNWYNRVFMPIGLRRQPPLEFQPGLPVDPRIDDVILVCRPA